MMRLVNSSCKPKLEALHTFPLFSILWKRIVLFPDKQKEFAKQIPEVETNTFTVFGFGVLFVFLQFALLDILLSNIRFNANYVYFEMNNGAI